MIRFAFHDQAMIFRLPSVLFTILAVLAAGVGACGAERPVDPDAPPAQEGAGLRLDEQTLLVPPPFPAAEPFGDRAALGSLDPVLRSDRVSVTVERTTYRPGDRLSLSVRYRDIPAGAGLKLELVRDVGVATRGLFPGAVGPLEIDLTPVSGSGVESFDWPASEVACAPTDGPMMCGPVTAGRYRIQATVYERSDFLTVGWPPRPMPAIVAETHSAPFRITGPAQLAAFEPSMRRVALQYAQASARTIGWRDTSERPVLTRDGAITASRRGICAEWVARPPLAGRVSTCAPAAAMGPEGLRVMSDEITAKGSVRWARGAIPYEDAILAALALARPPYLERMRPREGTRLRVAIPESAFRSDLAAWVIRVTMMESEGSSALPDRLQEYVTVCVNARTGAAHIVQAVPERSRQVIEPQTWPGPCPV
jgi:hypothetical protein